MDGPIHVQGRAMPALVRPARPRQRREMAGGGTAAGRPRPARGHGMAAAPHEGEPTQSVRAHVQRIRRLLHRTSPPPGRRRADGQLETQPEGGRAPPARRVRRDETRRHHTEHDPRLVRRRASGGTMGVQTRMRTAQGDPHGRGKPRHRRRTADYRVKPVPPADPARPGTGITRDPPVGRGHDRPHLLEDARIHARRRAAGRDGRWHEDRGTVRAAPGGRRPRTPDTQRQRQREPRAGRLGKVQDRPDEKPPLGCAHAPSRTCSCPCCANTWTHWTRTIQCSSRRSGAT